MAESAALSASREACRLMTRHHAKTFYFASHVLPKAKRLDAYAVYAFCRYVDDQIDLAPDEVSRLRSLAMLKDLLDVACDDAPPADDARAFASALPWLDAFRDT